ncbi:MAG: hypothetical protein NXI10_13090 [bacterium]|nr:hypothetical protein [bacterium]
MKFKLLTLFSIILALVIKTYSLSARDGVIDDDEVELLAQWELMNADDSLRHQQHIDILANELAESSQITEEFTGAGAMVKCTTYHRYARLRKAANEFELNELLTHESPVIRVYAHRAMMERNLNPNPDVVAQMAADSTEIEWLNGDVLIHTTVMDMVSSNMFRPEERDSLVAFLNF